MRAKPIAYGNDSAPPSDGPAKPVGTSAGRRAGAWFLHELREILPPTVFFFVGFNLIVLTTNLILADYLVAFGNFMLATAAALVVGKAVLVTKALPFLRRYDQAPFPRSSQRRTPRISRHRAAARSVSLKRAP
jgi:hypothetical protein